MFGTTPRKTNMSPENQWLENVFPNEIVPFLGIHVRFRGCNQCFFADGTKWESTNLMDLPLYKKKMVTQRGDDWPSLHEKYAPENQHGTWTLSFYTRQFSPNLRLFWFHVSFERRQQLFFHTASTQHSMDLLISVELKFHQVINGQSILNIVMDRDSAIVLCHLVLRTNLLSSALHQADALYICSPFGNWNSALSWNPCWGWLCSADAAGKKNC